MHADDHSDSDNDDVPLSASAPRKLAVDPDMLEEVMQLASAGERWADEATCSAQDCQFQAHVRARLCACACGSRTRWRNRAEELQQEEERSIMN